MAAPSHSTRPKEWFDRCDSELHRHMLMSNLRSRYKTSVNKLNHQLSHLIDVVDLLLQDELEGAHNTFASMNRENRRPRRKQVVPSGSSAQIIDAKALCSIFQEQGEDLQCHTWWILKPVDCCRVTTQCCK